MNVVRLKCASHRSDKASQIFQAFSPVNTVFASATTGVFKVIVIACNNSRPGLFIDSSSTSLKAMLLHDGNVCLSLLLVHTVQLKEDYSSVKTLLDAVKI